jgi:late competence protein required for DNA uptake (superfamily II DNA/RNA helicase)
MEYYLYSARAGRDTIMNITPNPSLDLAYLKDMYMTGSLELLTPGVGITEAEYMLKALDGNTHQLRSLIPIWKKGSERTSNSVKRASGDSSMTFLKNSRTVRDTESLPGERDLGTVLSIIEGHIMGYSDIKKAVARLNLFLDNDLTDILQTLYLSGRIHMLPSVSIDKAGKRVVCEWCGASLPYSIFEDGGACPSCSVILDGDEPLFAAGDYSSNGGYRHIKYKGAPGLNFIQDRTSMELERFLDDTREECLLWAISGSQNPGILARAIKNALERGRKPAVVVPSPDIMEEYHKSICDIFPAMKCVLGTDDKRGDIQLFLADDIRMYYSTFDLLIMGETPWQPQITGEHSISMARRALKEGGKLIYFTSSPSFSLYRRALEGDTAFVTVPVRENGRPSPEPRTVICRVMWGTDFFLSQEVLDFIVWSVREGCRAHIIVPGHDLAVLVEEKLADEGWVDREWLSPPNPRVAVTACGQVRTPTGQRENVIVLFADDSRVFDEKVLLDAAGLSSEAPAGECDEVVFVGARETDAMYNAKQMIRAMNKTAWEKGYLR